MFDAITKQSTMKKMILFGIASIFFSMITIAQTAIQGNVVDEISPLEWANIYIKNTTTGTTSDEAGNFILDVKKGDTLVISYTGYQTQEIVIDNQKYIPITLENEPLDEIVLIAHRIIVCKTFTHSCVSSHTTNCSSSGIKTETIPDDILSKNTNTKLYPNPSSDGVFHLAMTNSHKEVQIIVTNLLGQNVQSKTFQNTNSSITLDLSSVKTGVYLINMIADGERLPTQKAIRG